ncbi:NADase-type glycan-binding domain-containing protein [Kineosporia babensis]|uniref:Zinc ribbon domain-containing protein n=1 Tax=Kineosporia babensis TaxID=499548 RepID=A0A9X1SSC2_9ACTN|nr:hypothetical protein [Kineosporia babensis]MCD5310434.1 hypothetical protein [Kineosporia babensis]
MSSTEAAAPDLETAPPVCPGCHTVNEQERRLCKRCGAWLIEPPAARSAVHVPLRKRFQAWLFGTAEYGNGFGRGALIAWIAVVVVPLAVLAGLMVTKKIEPIRGSKDQLGHMRGSHPVDASAALGKKGSSTAVLAIDDYRNTAWQATWGGQPKTLTIRFSDKPDLREIGFQNGYLGNDPTVTRPKKVILKVKGKPHGQTIELRDRPGLQRSYVYLEAASEFEIVVAEVWQPSNEVQVAIGALSFWERP